MYDGQSSLRLGRRPDHGTMSARPDDDGVARALLAALTQLEREVVELRYTQRLDATDRTREGLRRLADAGSTPLGVLERAAGELGGAAAFDIVVTSRLNAGTIDPVARWHAPATRPPTGTAAAAAA